MVVAALLERQAGVRLLRRTRQGVGPTEAGRLLAGHADAVLDRLALASEQLAELAGLRRGRVRVGSCFTAFAPLTPTVAALLRDQHAPGALALLEILGELAPPPGTASGGGRGRGAAAWPP